VKLANKQALAAIIKERTGVAVNPASLFDIQVKCIHEYKRQHLNGLHLITLINRLKRHPKEDLTPRTFIFGGKAAPGYFMAKLIIKLINSVAEVVNKDPELRDRLKVVFFPDFNVKNGQLVYPAADLSEQISTAGKEASGTGNMKFALNGALTIGTQDGANGEIREEVGPENFFLFGLAAPQAADLKARGYNPLGYYESDRELREVLDLISSGFFPMATTSSFSPWWPRSCIGTNFCCWPTTGLMWTGPEPCEALFFFRPPFAPGLAGGLDGAGHHHRRLCRRIDSGRAAFPD
jgi:starch phosphorylase